MNDFTFPFDTCEQPNKTGIAQPYSVAVNIVIIAFVSYFLFNCNTFGAALLLVSILLFEIFHTFSHIVHIPGKIQTYVVHFFAYCVNSSLFYFLYNYTSKFPNMGFLCYLFLLVVIDLYALSRTNIIIYLTTQTVIFVSLLLYFYKYLSSRIQQGIKIISILAVLAILLELNEIYNCKTLLSYFPHFPFHILIETTILSVFWVVCSIFYKI
jgi:hypothetical protein